MRSYSDLRAAQHRIADRIYENDASQIVLGMGGGKTAATLTALSELIRDGVIDCAIVVAPPLVAATVWENEVAKWEHLSCLQVATIVGSRRQRNRDMKDAADVYVISETVAEWLRKYLYCMAHRPHFGRFALVMDDCSIRGPRGKIGKDLRTIAQLPGCKVVVRLTGTPRPNGWEDQWMPMQIITKGQMWNEPEANMDAFTAWRSRNFRPMDYNGYNWKVHDFRERQLLEQVAPYTLTIEDKDMPEMPELNAGPDSDWVVDLPAEARAKYDEMEKKLVVEATANIERTVEQIKFDGNDEDIDSAIEALLIAALSEGAKSGKLAQIAQGYLYDEGKAVSYLHDQKVEALREIRESAIGEPLLIYYGFKHDLPLIRKALGKRSVPTLVGAKAAQAQKVIDQWNAGELQELVIHPASAAHGIELQHGPGRRIVGFCPTWSTERYQQIIRRVQRPGQGRPVFVHQILARDTVDEIKVNRVAHRIEEQDRFREMVEEVRRGL